jgi:hypothetical protein
MKLSRRGKRTNHARRGKHTKRVRKHHTRRIKHRGKQYKRTYRKNNRKLKHNKRIQRGGWEWETEGENMVAKGVLLKYKKISQTFGDGETKPFNITLKFSINDNVTSFTLTMVRQTDPPKTFVLYFKVVYELGIRGPTTRVYFSTTQEFEPSDSNSIQNLTVINIKPIEEEELYNFLDTGKRVINKTFFKDLLPRKMMGLALAEVKKAQEKIENEKSMRESEAYRSSPDREKEKRIRERVKQIEASVDDIKFGSESLNFSTFMVNIEKEVNDIIEKLRKTALPRHDQDDYVVVLRDSYRKIEGLLHSIAEQVASAEVESVAPADIESAPVESAPVESAKAEKEYKNLKYSVSDLNKYMRELTEKITYTTA